MKYFRPVDFAAFPADEFKSQLLADPSTGVEGARIVAIRIPPGKASPAGLHVHPVDQFYYVLEGTTTIQLGTKQHTVSAPALIYIPAGLPHANWNASSEPEFHLEMLCPVPAEGQPQSERLTEAKDIPLNVELIRPLDESKFGMGSGMSQNLASKASGVSSLSWNVFRIPAGGGVQTPHMHGFTHIYYIVSGQLTIQMGFEEHVLKPGTLGIIPPWLVHCNRNDGPDVEVNLNIRVPEAETPFMQGTQIQFLNPQGRTPAG